MKVKQAERFERHRQKQLDQARQDMLRQRGKHHTLLDALEKARRELSQPPRVTRGGASSGDCVIEELAHWRQRAQASDIKQKTDAQERAVRQATSSFRQAHNEHSISDHLLKNALERQRCALRRREQRQLDDLTARSWLLRANES